MFTTQITKSGSIAVIFPNNDASRALIGRMFGIVADVLALPSTSTESKVPDSDVLNSAATKFAESRTGRTKDSTPKKTAKQPYDYEKLTPEQRKWEDQRYEINAALTELATKKGLRLSNRSFANLHTSIYAAMQREFGFRPRKDTVLKYTGKYVGTRINTVLVEEMAGHMLICINREIRLLNKTEAPIVKDPKLRLVKAHTIRSR